MLRRCFTGLAAALALALAGCATQSSPPVIEHHSGFADANGIRIAYKSDGPADGAPLLIVTGLGGQMSEHVDGFTQSLIDRGFRVIRFDNRDAGLTTHMTAAGAPPSLESIVAAMQAGQPTPLAYTIHDMANDTVALLDALGVEKVHLVGGSMGGMIGQIIAADHPDRVLSFTSIMSTSGNPELPYGPAMQQLGQTVGVGGTPDEILERRVALFRLLEGPAYRSDEGVLREQLRRSAERASDPLATARQGASVIPYADRRDRLARITAPTMIIHGSDDPLFPVSHAEDQAAHTPNAQLVIIPGMGHDLPDALGPRMAELIAQNAARASQ